MSAASPPALADAILIIHSIFVGVVVFSVPLIILGGIRRWHWVRNPLFRFTHLAMIGFVTFEAVIGMECPLTVWESGLRLRSGGSGYSHEGFIADLLARLLYYPFPHWVFTALYSGYGLIVLALFYAVPVQRHGRHPLPAPARKLD